MNSVHSSTAFQVFSWFSPHGYNSVLAPYLSLPRALLAAFLPFSGPIAASRFSASSFFANLSFIMRSTVSMNRSSSSLISSSSSQGVVRPLRGMHHRTFTDRLLVRIRRERPREVRVVAEEGFSRHWNSLRALFHQGFPIFPSHGFTPRFLLCTSLDGDLLAPIEVQEPHRYASTAGVQTSHRWQCGRRPSQLFKLRKRDVTVMDRRRLPPEHKLHIIHIKYLYPNASPPTHEPLSLKPRSSPGQAPSSH